MLWDRRRYPQRSLNSVTERGPVLRVWVCAGDSKKEIRKQEPILDWILQKGKQFMIVYISVYAEGKRIQVELWLLIRRGRIWSSLWN